MKSEIKYTSDYSLFIHHENQQPMSEKHVKALALSMRRVGFLGSKPITVVRKGTKLSIVDGHHRFWAGKINGIPVAYVIEEKAVSDEIGLLNSTVKTWSGMSFVNMWADRGNPHFITLREYIQSGIPLNMATSILRGEGASSGNFAHTIKDGTFTVKTTKAAESLASLMRSVSSEIPEIKSRSYLSAVALLLFLPDFDLAVLERRMKINPRAAVKCAEREQALDVLEFIYNFRSVKKVALKIPALDASKARQKAVIGKKADK